MSAVIEKKQENTVENNIDNNIDVIIYSNNSLIAM